MITKKIREMNSLGGLGLLNARAAALEEKFNDLSGPNFGIPVLNRKAERREDAGGDWYGVLRSDVVGREKPEQLRREEFRTERSACEDGESAGHLFWRHVGDWVADGHSTKLGLSIAPCPNYPIGQGSISVSNVCDNVLNMMTNRRQLMYSLESEKGGENLVRTRIQEDRSLLNLDMIIYNAMAPSMRLVQRIRDNLGMQSHSLNTLRVRI